MSLHLLLSTNLSPMVKLDHLFIIHYLLWEIHSVLGRRTEKALFISLSDIHPKWNSKLPKIYLSFVNMNVLNGCLSMVFLVHFLTSQFLHDSMYVIGTYKIWSLYNLAFYKIIKGGTKWTHMYSLVALLMRWLHGISRWRITSFLLYIYWISSLFLSSSILRQRKIFWISPFYSHISTCINVISRCSLVVKQVDPLGNRIDPASPLLSRSYLSSPLSLISYPHSSLLYKHYKHQTHSYNYFLSFSQLHFFQSCLKFPIASWFVHFLFFFHFLNVFLLFSECLSIFSLSVM